MTSGQETERVHSYNAGARMGHHNYSDIYCTNGKNVDRGNEKKFAVITDVEVILR